jgi:hypothetical protein
VVSICGYGLRVPWFRPETGERREAPPKPVAAQIAENAENAEVPPPHDEPPSSASIGVYLRFQLPVRVFRIFRGSPDIPIRLNADSLLVTGPARRVSGVSPRVTAVSGHVNRLSSRGTGPAPPRKHDLVPHTWGLTIAFGVWGLLFGV